MFRFEQREPWRAQAEEACLSQRLVQPSAYVAMSSKIDGPGVCGMDYPFKVAAFNNGEIGLKSKVTLACPIIPRIDTWLDEIVKPAAVMYFGVPVVDLKAGSYSCRPRNNRRGAKLSEHSFGNALDIMAFVLADGREITVMKGWKGNPAEQDFLREAFVGACRYFTTVLGPGADAFHYDHLHIDLARHDPRGERRICKPIIKFTPRIDPDQSRQIFQSVSAQGDLPATELEQDVPEEGASAGYAADLPMGAPMAPPVVSAPVPPPAPRYPANTTYSGNTAQDLYTPPPPPGYSAAFPQRSTQQPQQTYAPPRPMRSSAGEPMVLNRHAVH
ncbi:extensin family protein [Microvirga vignae]|uniref:extensin-like domain-containing protein n=1 Tax=Microvirga vignae TaxID=1225564 RepID=UPI001FCD1B76|nr:extensin family protein [Microvirga vignae]